MTKFSTADLNGYSSLAERSGYWFNIILGILSQEDKKSQAKYFFEKKTRTFLEEKRALPRQIKDLLHKSLEREKNDFLETIKEGDAEKTERFHKYATFLEKNHYFLEVIQKEMRMLRWDYERFIILACSKKRNLKNFLLEGYPTEELNGNSIEKEQAQISEIFQKYYENWKEILIEEIRKMEEE